MGVECQPIFGRSAGLYNVVVFDPFTECFTIYTSLGWVTAVLHYECFTDAYFFFDVFVDSPQILRRFRMISFVSSMLPGSGFFRPKSLKSLDFLGPVCFRISSFNDFLNGGFFSLIMYILILFINKVKRLCHQNHHRIWSFCIVHICCGLYLYHPLDVVA